MSLIVLGFYFNSEVLKVGLYLLSSLPAMVVIFAVKSFYQQNKKIHFIAGIFVLIGLALSIILGGQHGYHG